MRALRHFGSQRTRPGPAADRFPALFLALFLPMTAAGGPLVTNTYPMIHWVTVTTKDGALLYRAENLRVLNMDASPWDAETGRRARAYLRFDLSGLEAGTQVSSATLRVYLVERTNPDYNADTFLYQVTSAWTAADAEFDELVATPALTNFARTDGTYNNVPWPAWYELDVTSAVNDWRSNANHGFSLRIAEGPYSGTLRNFTVVGDYAPQLVVVGTGLRPVTYAITNAAVDQYQTVRNDSTRTLELQSGNVTAPYLNPRAFLRFQLTPLPPREQFLCAMLRVYVSDAGQWNWAAYLKRVQAAWATNDIAYNIAVDDLQAFSFYDQPAAQRLGWFNLDVTTTVSNWLYGGSGNYGFGLRSAEGDYTYVQRVFGASGGTAPVLQITTLRHAPSNGVLLRIY